MASVALDSRQPSSLDRFLRLFAEVRPGESATALLLLLNLFLLLVGYYVVKTVAGRMVEWLSSRACFRRERPQLWQVSRPTRAHSTRR